jgi:membrane protease YdiL (CAAX protease family)
LTELERKLNIEHMLNLSSPTQASAPRITASRATALLALCLLAVQAALRFDTPLARACVGATLIVAFAASRIASAPAQAVTVQVALLAVASSLIPIWQAAMLVAIAACAIAARSFPSIRPSASVTARGAVPALPTVFVGAVTPFALTAWLVLARPDLRDLLAGYVPKLPFAVLVAGGVAFVFVNAALEELTWRGILFDRLEPLFGLRGAIVVQALSFGLMHAHGFPRGPSGVALAAIWALMLGWLRSRSGGLLATFVAHVVADATIAIIVLGYLR